MKLSASEKTRLKKRYGPWAVVTGASSGIGLEIAGQLASAGIHLLLHARREETLRAIAHDFHRKHGIQTRLVASDASTPAGVSAIVEAAKNMDVGLFVGSAGFGTSGLFVESSLEEEINMLRVNCEAILSLTHHFSNVFVRQRRGGIILMSSLVGFQGVPYAASYAATKAYVQSLAEALSVELKPMGVDVLAAAPGPVASGFGERANLKMDVSLKPEQVGVPILRALGRKSTVLPGFLTKFLVGSLRTVPRWGKVRIMKMVMGGMTKHQRAIA
ncbi:MAG: SDR family NAD(P)-dependent oxidoreductase [Saprospiraceae bacterium]|nr:SDR family NAD(P)-dependent oxidoreductase [Saprospiraceae bacterium]